MHCEDALAQIDSYVDEQLNESQAAPLRRHLIECSSCRLAAQEAEALKSWFVDPEALVGPAEAPEGFAERITELAFGPQVQKGPRSLQPALAGAGHGDHAVNELSGFVLNLVAAAAVVLLLLAFGIKRSSLPEVEHLNADSSSMTQSLEALDALNEEGAEVPAARSNR